MRFETASEIRGAESAGRASWSRSFWVVRIGSGGLHTAEESRSTNGGRGERMGALHAGSEGSSAADCWERRSRSNDHVVLGVSSGDTTNMSIREGFVERAPELDELRFRSRDKFIQTSWSSNSNNVVLRSETLVS